MSVVVIYLLLILETKRKVSFISNVHMRVCLVAESTEDVKNCESALH